MEVKIDKSFQKDTRRIKDKSILQRIANTVANVQRAKNLEEIKNLKKIQGTQSKYRIRIGEYRLGIIVSDRVQWSLFVVCTERTFISISQSKQEKVEQYAEADLLAVMLFAEVELIVL